LRRYLKAELFCRQKVNLTLRYDDINFLISAVVTKKRVAIASLVEHEGRQGGSSQHLPSD
jgi:hypothetical protein